MTERENDVLTMIPPATGAAVVMLEDPARPDARIPAALYQTAGEGGAMPALLYRFRPSAMQRGRIALGEDLFLLMLLPNGRAALPIELQVGPGQYQLEGHIERLPTISEPWDRRDDGRHLVVPGAET